MNYIERINELRKQEKEVQAEIEGLKKGLEHDDWVFCVHTHYDKPRVAVWGKDKTTDFTAMFQIEGDHVSLLSAGEYWDSWHEAESLLDEWLSGEFAEEQIKVAGTA